MNKIKSVLFVSLLLVSNSCKEDPAVPDNLVNFESNAVGSAENETTLKIILSRAVSADTEVTISFVGTNATYGTEFTTDPAATGSLISLTILSGQSGAAFTVIKPDGFFYNGDESIEFTLVSAGDNLVLGETLTTSFSFGAITSQGATVTLQGKEDGGDPSNVYKNMAFVDMSGNKGTSVSRKSWNLAFYSGAEFRVALNPAYQSAAAPTTKIDITAVDATDADAIEASANNLNFAPAAGALAVVDSWDGNLGGTAFAAVSANDADNLVYLMSFEGSKTKDKWLKVKVVRNGNGYRVSYALVGSSSIQTLDVPKSSDYNFTFVSLENDAVVSVEPKAQNWDIYWSYSTYNAGNNTPYWFQDFIILNNLAGAGAAEVVSVDAVASEAAYIAFDEAAIASVTFLTTRDAIGSKWRVTNPATGIKRDRFYVIRDPRGNVYKLKFVTMGVGGDGGERGRPVVEYKLVKAI